MIYLDSASTTKTDPCVLDAMLPYLQDEYGNPGTIYSFGRNIKNAVESARGNVAKMIGAESNQIVFTSGGTEANNMVFFSLVNHLKRLGKNHIIVSAVEHDSVIHTVGALAKNYGFEVSYIDVNEYGVVDSKELTPLIKDNTGLVSVMHTNNETGSENPIEDLSRVCHERNVLFHSDCVQAASNNKIDVKELGCDFVSLSSHKIYGCKGIGALFVKDKTILSPAIYGGLSQEFGLRSGTENVPAIVGFGRACEMMVNDVDAIDDWTTSLKRLFYSKLKKHLSKCGLNNILHVNGDSINKHGKILNIRFDKVDGETLLLMMDERNVFVSAGSACRSHETIPSRVLMAMGVSPEDARNSIRISFSKDNTIKEIDMAAKILASCVRTLIDLYKG